MRILKDFKVPDFKFPKLKMKDIEDIEEVKVDYERLQKKQIIAQKRKESIVRPSSPVTGR